MNMIKIEEKFTSLTEKDLATVEGGRVSWRGNINIDVHKVIDSTGRFSVVSIMLVDHLGEMFTMHFINIVY